MFESPHSMAPVWHKNNSALSFTGNNGSSFDGVFIAKRHHLSDDTPSSMKLVSAASGEAIDNLDSRQLPPSIMQGRRHTLLVAPISLLFSCHIQPQVRSCTHASRCPCRTQEPGLRPLRSIQEQDLSQSQTSRPFVQRF